MKFIASIILLLLPSMAFGQATVTVSPPFKQQFLDNSGKPLAGGKVCSYQAGTNNLLATYTDSTGSVQNTNPVVLDAGGRASIWLLQQAYKVVLYDSTGTPNTCNGNQIYSQDNILPSCAVGLTCLIAGANNTFTGNNTFSGNATFNGTTTLNGPVSGALPYVVVDGVKYTTVQAAINALPTSTNIGGTVFIPCGIWPVTGAFNWPSGVKLVSLCGPLDTSVGVSGSLFPANPLNVVRLQFNQSQTITNSFGIGAQDILFDFSGVVNGQLVLAGVSHSNFRMAVQCQTASNAPCVLWKGASPTLIQNMAQNTFDVLWTFGGNEGLRVDNNPSGNPPGAAGSFSTVNLVHRLLIVQSHSIGLNFCGGDSNTFDDIGVTPYNVIATYQPVVFNGCNPGIDADVENEIINNIWTNTPNTGACVNAITFNFGYGNKVRAGELSCTNSFAVGSPAATFEFCTMSRAGTSGTPPTCTYQGLTVTEQLSSTGGGANAVHNFIGVDNSIPFTISNSTPASGLSPSAGWCDTTPTCFYAKKSSTNFMLTNAGGTNSWSFPMTLGNVTARYTQETRGTAGCTTGAVAGNNCAAAITVNWPTSFADTNYSAVCSGQGTPTASPSGVYVVSKAVGSIVANYFTITAVAASYPTIDCIAVHD